jgi:putative FmdB family regulatory protein
MTYEYVCTACHHEWEASQPISDPPLKACPECSQQTAKRQISRGGGFVLKGGGWYSDLYSSSRPASDSSSESSSSSDKSESAPKADAKAAPAETKPAPAETKAAAPAKPASTPSST